MAKEQSEKNCYPSKYSPSGWVRPDQYIIELVCEKKANCLKKELPIKFWKDSDWEKYFKSQLRKCNTLLKKYSHKAVIQALNDKRCWNIYSLFAPWLEDVIKEKQRIADRPVIEEEKPEMTIGEYKKPKKKKGILDLLE